VSYRTGLDGLNCGHVHSIMIIIMIYASILTASDGIEGPVIIRIRNMVRNDVKTSCQRYQTHHVICLKHRKQKGIGSIYTLIDINLRGKLYFHDSISDDIGQLSQD
jgi:hypothetical protein